MKGEHSEDVEGNWKKDCLLQWPVTFFVFLHKFWSLFLALSSRLPSSESSYPYPPSMESPVTNKGLSQGLSTPIQLYPRLRWGTLKQDLALRQRMPCTPAHRGCTHSTVPLKGQTVLCLNHEVTERNSSTVSPPECNPSLIM